MDAEALGLCLRPWEEHLVRVSDPDDAEMVENTLRMMTESNGLKILVLNYRENH